eukprot:gene18138-biopygen17379
MPQECRRSRFCLQNAPAAECRRNAGGMPEECRRSRFSPAREARRGKKCGVFSVKSCFSGRAAPGKNLPRPANRNARGMPEECRRNAGGMPEECRRSKILGTALQVPAAGLRQE